MYVVLCKWSLNICLKWELCSITSTHVQLQSLACLSSGTIIYIENLLSNYLLTIRSFPPCPDEHNHCLAEL